VFVGITGLLFATDSGDKPARKPADTTTRPATQPASQPASQPAKPQVVIDTNFGEIVLELDADRTPATVKNFLTYVDEKFYDGLIFHRVIKGFMIQGGGFTPDHRQKQVTHPPVVNESGKGASNTRGTIAMARTADPNSATSQFFINHGNNSRLDRWGGGYTVFGRVVKGMDVVDKIADVPVEMNEMGERARPTQNVMTKSVRRK
jgi:cyclophilin family peptidyl-prolyl cis-trans isomerase